MTGLFLAAIASQPLVRARIDVALGESKLASFSRWSGANGREARKWSVSKGGLECRWGETGWTFARDGIQLVSYGHPRFEPFKTGELDDEDLKARAERIRDSLFGGQEWILERRTRIDPKQFDPPMVTSVWGIKAGSTSHLRRLVVRLERASGAPLMILVFYKDDNFVSGVYRNQGENHEFTIGRDLPPPP